MTPLSELMARNLHTWCLLFDNMNPLCPSRGGGLSHSRFLIHPNWCEVDFCASTYWVCVKIDGDGWFPFGVQRKSRNQRLHPSSPPSPRRRFAGQAMAKAGRDIPELHVAVKALQKAKTWGVGRLGRLGRLGRAMFKPRDLGPWDLSHGLRGPPDLGRYGLKRERSLQRTSRLGRVIHVRSVFSSLMLSNQSHNEASRGPSLECH